MKNVTISIHRIENLKLTQTGIILIKSDANAPEKEITLLDNNANVTDNFTASNETHLEDIYKLVCERNEINFSNHSIYQILPV